MAEPVEDHLAGEVVQRPGQTGDGESPVTEVDVIDLGELADRLGAGSVDGGQREDEPESRRLQGQAFHGLVRDVVAVSAAG